MTEAGTKLQIAATSWFAIGVVASAVIVTGPWRPSEPVAILVAAVFSLCLQGVRWLGTAYFTRHLNGTAGSAKSERTIAVILDPRRRDVTKQTVDLQVLWGYKTGIALAAETTSEAGRCLREAWFEHQRAHLRSGHPAVAAFAQLLGTFGAIWILLDWDASVVDLRNSVVGAVIVICIVAAISLWEAALRRLLEADLRRRGETFPSPGARIEAGRDLPLNPPVCVWSSSMLEESVTGADDH